MMFPFTFSYTQLLPCISVSTAICYAWLLLPPRFALFCLLRILIRNSSLSLEFVCAEFSSHGDR